MPQTPLWNTTVGSDIRLPRWECKPRNSVCAPGRLRACKTAHTPLHTLLKNKQVVQCEGPQPRKEEIRDESEINRRLLTEGSQDHSAVPAPSPPSKLPLHSRTTSGKNPSGRARVKCWPHHYMHWHWLGNWLVAGFTAILLADVAYPDRPGLGEQIQKVPQ